MSVLTRDLGLRLSPSDLEAGLRRLPVNDQGQVAYLRLLHGGGHNKALKKGGLMGHTQAAAAAGERGWNGVCGNEVANRIGRMLRSRYGSVEHAFRVVLDVRSHPSHHGCQYEVHSRSCTRETEASSKG